MWCDKIPDWVVTCLGISWAVIIAAAVGLFEIALYAWGRWHARRAAKRRILEVYERLATDIKEHRDTRERARRQE